MSKKANEIFEYAKRKRDMFDQKILTSLKERAVESVTEMMKDGRYSTEIELNDKDLFVIQEVTSEMRELGYRYCLIETQDEDENIVGHRLRVSVEHLGNQ